MSQHLKSSIFFLSCLIFDYHHAMFEFGKENTFTRILRLQLRKKEEKEKQIGIFYFHPNDYGKVLILSAPIGLL
jgi:hypothetical protein